MTICSFRQTQKRMPLGSYRYIVTPLVVKFEGGEHPEAAGAAGTPPEVSPQRRGGYNPWFVHCRYYELYRRKTDRHGLHQKLVAHARQHGVQDAARVFGCSRNTVRKWLRRYQPGQPSSLAERSRRPHHCPQQTASSVEGRVVRLRRQTGCGAERLKREFALACSAGAIHRIVRTHGLVHTRPKKHQRKKCLRQLKRTWPLFSQLVADTKYLQETSHTTG